MAKISAETCKEIRQIILAGRLFPVAELSLKSLLNRSGMGLYQSIISKELQKVASENPKFKDSFYADSEDAYIQIDLLEEAKDIFVRYIDADAYQMGMKVLQRDNIVPNGFNQEILELRKKRTRDIKAELADILKGYNDSEPLEGSEAEKALSICICIFESSVYSRSLLGRIEGFLIKHFSAVNIPNVEKEILLSI